MRRVLLLLATAPAWAQDPLSLREAVRLGVRSNPSLAAAAAGIKAADARIGQARSGGLPKVNYTESFTRSDNPVFVFSSLLTQRQFGQENFNIATLNRPDFLNNFQSQITLDQPLYDANRTRYAVQSAEIGRALTTEEQRRAQLDVISAIVRAYNDAALAAENLETARQALRSAEADLRRAQTVRAAGMSTDVDVLSIRVHLAAVTERRVKAAADLDVARAALNGALGLPLDTPHQLTTDLKRADVADLSLEQWEKSAAGERPEMKETRLASSLAQTDSAAARSALLPQIDFHAGFEADRQTFATRGGANWMVGVSMRVNLFNGFADKQRITETAHLMERARAGERQADTAVRLQVRRAYADLRSAEQRIEAAQASVAESEESLRIVQNRYEAGMSDVTDLLRNETAVLESRTRYLAAVHDQRIAAAMLELAAGRLSPDSQVLD
jgi:outer membrane protein TolC